MTYNTINAIPIGPSLFGDDDDSGAGPLHPPGQAHLEVKSKSLDMMKDIHVRMMKDCLAVEWVDCDEWMDKVVCQHIDTQNNWHRWSTYIYKFSVVPMCR